jgi:hypothetical protein
LGEVVNTSEIEQVSRRKDARTVPRRGFFSKEFPSARKS